MSLALYPVALLIALTAAVSAVVGFAVGYIVGRRTHNPFRFAIKFSALQITALVLFVVYNKFLTNQPDQLVNLGILAMIGGESLGMLFTRGVDKAIEKAAGNDTDATHSK